MATDSTAATAKLIWSTSDGLRLKLKANEVVALNKEYTYETGQPLPDGLAIYDEDKDKIDNPSFVSIRKNYSIQYRDIRYYFKDVVAERPSPQQQNLQVANSSLLEAFKNLSFEVHGIREALPSVLVGHVISPSEASKKPQAVATVFDALGLELVPRNDGSTYHLPDTCGPEWNFSWQWPRDATDDRILERQSYEPVCNFLKKIPLIGEDVSDGQNCVKGLLFNDNIFTCRRENPHLVRGQKVYHRHRVVGRTDIAVLKEERRGHILRHMVKFAIELKTVEGYRQSTTGCMREAQLQLIGLNAFNTLSSPPVLLSNLAKKHQVVYLDKDEDWNYDIAVQNCATFAAAVHFAQQKSEEGSISEQFARPNTPQSLDSSS